MIRSYRPGDLDAVRFLLMAEGWSGRAENRELLSRVIESATRAVVADVDQQVVGFGRCVTDGTSNGYLSMVVVEASHRRQGIGRSIVEALMGDAAGLTWVLRAGHPGSESFWEAIGFRRSRITYERPRR